MLECTFLLPGGALLSDPFVHVGSGWGHTLYPYSGQLDREHGWAHAYIPTRGGVAAADSGAPGFTFYLLVYVCEELFSGLLDTIVGHGGEGHLS